jgi:cytochrome c peroxidase
MRPTISFCKFIGTVMLHGIVFALLSGIAAAQTDEPIKPIPIELKLDQRKVALGEKLFNDKRLSRDNTLSCASCHNLSTGGIDGMAISVGINGAKSAVNAPTVFNSGLNFRQFWDGRANSLEEQSAGPVHNPREMGSNWAEVLGKLAQDTALVAQFKALYADGLQSKNIQDGIGTFGRSLFTPNARFDRYLRGDKNAINAEELKGYELFKKYGCVACHQGVAVGGNMFQTFGVMGDYFATRGNPTEADLGRYNVTKNEADKHVFKVPSLRNVALTAPYFHDGSAKTLNDAVAVMFKYQLGRNASSQDQAQVVLFLRTLTGEYQGKPLDRIERTTAK